MENPVLKEFDEFNDQVADMIYLAYRKTLICGSGDGSLLIIDAKKLTALSLTESFDDEVTALLALKSESKILCATGLGDINVFGYNYWGIVQDRLPQHPATVNCMLANDEGLNYFFTGCADGMVRALTMQPSAITGELLKLDESIERMAKLSFGDSAYLLVTTCTDDCLQVIDLKTVFDTELPLDSLKKTGKRKLEQVDKLKAEKKVFFADL